MQPILGPRPDIMGRMCIVLIGKCPVVTLDSIVAVFLVCGHTPFYECGSYIRSMGPFSPLAKLVGGTISL